MFRHKAEKRIVELSPEQIRLAKYALLEFRNELLAQGKPTEDVNELLLKIMKQDRDSRREIKTCGCPIKENQKMWLFALKFTVKMWDNR